MFYHIDDMMLTYNSTVEFKAALPIVMSHLKTSDSEVNEFKMH